MFWHLSRFVKEFAPDQHPPDLAGSGADLVQLCIAEQAAGRVFIDVAVAPQDLDRLQRHPGGLFGGVQDCAGGIFSDRVFAAAGVCHRVDIGPAGIHRAVHIGNFALHQLKFAYGLAELPPLVDIGNDDIHAGPHYSQRSGRQYRPLVIEAAHQDPDAVADLAHHIFRRHLAILEHQFAGIGAAHAELVELLGGGEPLEGLLYQERGNPLRAGVDIGLGIHQQRVGMWAVGDPHLGAVQYETVALPVRSQSHTDDIRPGTRFAHREGADMFTADQPGEVAPFLLFAGIAVNLVDAEIGMSAVGKGNGRRGAADLLDGHDMLQIRHPGTAVFFGNGDAVQPQIAHLPPEVHRKMIFAVDIGRPGSNLRPGKRHDGVPQQISGITQIKI